MQCSFIYCQNTSFLNCKVWHGPGIKLPTFLEFDMAYIIFRMGTFDLHATFLNIFSASLVSHIFLAGNNKENAQDSKYKSSHLWSWQGCSIIMPKHLFSCPNSFSDSSAKAYEMHPLNSFTAFLFCNTRPWMDELTNSFGSRIQDPPTAGRRPPPPAASCRPSPPPARPPPHAVRPPQAGWPPAWARWAPWPYGPHGSTWAPWRFLAFD